MIALVSTVPAARRELTDQEMLTELQETVSASRLTCFLQCRLKFFFRYVKEIQKPKTPALHVGHTVHAVLKAWSKARWRGEPLSPDQLQSVYQTEWASDQEGAVQWENTDEEQEQKEVGWKLLECYFSNSPLDPAVKPEAVEIPVEADLAAHGLPALVGVLDLVTDRRIVDFKTTSTTPNPHTVAHVHEVQASSYAVLYRASTGERESGIEFHSLVKLKTPKLVVTALQPMSNQQQSRLFRLIEAYVEGLQRQDFIPSPGMTCLSCEFFGECRKWSG